MQAVHIIINWNNFVSKLKLRKSGEANLSSQADFFSVDLEQKAGSRKI
jgi:hypothetical protein